jgi:hypothetical protein
MAVSSKPMIVEAAHRFPCWIKLGVPFGGFGERLTKMHAWHDQNCGANAWTVPPAGLRGVANDAVAIYFLDATLAAAFVTKWCAGSNMVISEDAFRVREDRPARRNVAGPHRTS